MALHDREGIIEMNGEELHDASSLLETRSQHKEDLKEDATNPTKEVEDRVLGVNSNPLDTQMINQPVKESLGATEHPTGPCQSINAYGYTPEDEPTAHNNQGNEDPEESRQSTEVITNNGSKTLHINIADGDDNASKDGFSPSDTQSGNAIIKTSEESMEGSTDLTCANVKPSIVDTDDDASKDGSTASENETGERPVRKKLKETTIASAPEAPPGGYTKNITDNGPTSAQENETGGDSDRGRTTKKRSFEDLQSEDKDNSNLSRGDGGHRRKRSCDSKTGDDADAQKLRDSTPSDESRDDDEASRPKALSPKKKRSIDQLENDDTEIEALTATRLESSDEKPLIEGEPEKKRHRDDSQERRPAPTQMDAVAATAPLPNAFSNTSTVSPFASLASPKSEPTIAEKADAAKPGHITSAAAFASSGLAAFAGSEQSPFGAIGSAENAPSIFKSAPNTSPEKLTGVGFAATSPFAVTGRPGFGNIGSGFAGSIFGGSFASVGKLGSGLTSFASPSGPGIFGSSTQAKPLGVSGNDSGEEKEEEENKPIKSFEKEKEDQRFFEQEIETGEEDEKIYFTCKAKLFHFTGKEWKERGLGTFKVNVKEPDDDEGEKKSARMIMRADGVLRVMLNTPLFKGMRVGDAVGKEPTTKQIHLASFENGRSVPLLLRTGNNELAKELYHVIQELLEQI